MILSYYMLSSGCWVRRPEGLVTGRVMTHSQTSPHHVVGVSWSIPLSGVLFMMSWTSLLAQHQNGQRVMTCLSVSMSLNLLKNVIHKDWIIFYVAQMWWCGQHPHDARKLVVVRSAVTMTQDISGGAVSSHHGARRLLVVLSAATSHRGARRLAVVRSALTTA